MSQYLIKKYGDGYWRPDRCGYTENILEAGTYSALEAAEFKDKKSNHSYAIPLEEVRKQIESAIERLNSNLLHLGGYCLSEYPGDPRD